jgi:hypothetical protein
MVSNFFIDNVDNGFSSITIYIRNLLQKEKAGAYGLQEELLRFRALKFFKKR